MCSIKTILSILSHALVRLQKSYQPDGKINYKTGVLSVKLGWHAQRFQYFIARAYQIGKRLYTSCQMRCRLDVDSGITAKFHEFCRYRNSSNVAGISDVIRIYLHITYTRYPIFHSIRSCIIYTSIASFP